MLVCVSINIPPLRGYTHLEKVHVLKIDTYVLVILQPIHYFSGSSKA